MPTAIITTDDLREFKIELLEEFTSLMKRQKYVILFLSNLLLRNSQNSLSRCYLRIHHKRFLIEEFDHGSD